jgi:hypothetical protein
MKWRLASRNSGLSSDWANHGEYYDRWANQSKMNTRKQRLNNDPIRQAELILKLYELRREAVMREARSYVGGKFLPQSASELFDIVTAGTRESGFVLQVYGYWDMVAAFVSNGALDAQLVYDTCQEMYFQYAKIQPYLAEFRQKMNLPEFLISIERLIEGSEAGRRRLDVMLKSLSVMAGVRDR